MTGNVLLQRRRLPIWDHSLPATGEGGAGLTGNVLLAAAQIAYLGPFTASYR